MSVEDELKAEARVETEVVLLFLSNLIISKGVLVLLEACQLLKQRDVAFHCNVVGGAGDLSEHDFELKIKELELESQVSFLGKKYGADKNEVFMATSIFVLPTFYENECFPLVLLEAMQFSLPSVSTREGGIPSIIEEGETGFMIEKNNATALANVLEKLISSKDLRLRLGNNARFKFENNFKLNEFENNFNSILKNVLGE